MTRNRIELLQPDTALVQAARYHAGPKILEFETAEVDKLLGENVIEPAQTKWAVPIVFVPKKDRTLQFFVDYRKLNGVTKQNSYLITRLNECIDSLVEATVFKTLDANSGYRKVEIDDADENNMALTSPHGLHCFIHMSFGLCS